MQVLQGKNQRGMGMKKNQKYKIKNIKSKIKYMKEIISEFQENIDRRKFFKYAGMGLFLIFSFPFLRKIESFGNKFLSSVKRINIPLKKFRHSDLYSPDKLAG
jgi:hypothetical protein